MLVTGARVKYFRLLPLSLLVFFVLTPNCYAQAPVCDGINCVPNPGDPSYGGAVEARTAPLNARGTSSPLIARVTPSFGKLPLEVPRTETVIGSQSYSYAIPIVSWPGRAGKDLVLNLYYNSRVWDVDTSGGTITFNADRDYPSYGFRLDFGYLEITPGQEIILTKGDGTKIPLIFPEGVAVATALDGSNTVFDLSGSNIVTYNDGTQVLYEPFPSNANLMRPIWSRDRNGNVMFIAYMSGHDQLITAISDSTGRILNFNYDGSNRLVSIAQALHPTGVKTYATFTWGNPYSAGYTWYSFSGLAVKAAPTASQISVLVGCTYPNGTGYRFTYGDWGVIKKIEHLSASGATLNYLSYNYPLASQGALTDAPFFTQQTVSPDGTDTNTSVWNYSVTKSGTGQVTSMAVTDPVGSTTTTTVDPASGLTSSIQLKDINNAVLRTSTYAWTSTALGSTAPGTITTTLSDTGQQSAIQYAYDGFDNISDVYEYDFGLQLKRHTVTTYLIAQNTGAAHITNLPTQTLVKDGAGNVVSRTDMAYDQFSLTSVVGAANHEDGGYSASFNVRGNLTTITRYSNAAAGTGAITRTFTYDNLGNVRTAQVDCCNLKTFNFSTTTQYAEPDSIVRGPLTGPQFTTGYTYNIDNGLLLTSTDENGQLTQYQYDVMNRPTAVTLPAQGGVLVQSNTSYDDSSVPSTTTSYTTNAGNSGSTVATLDGLGHVLQVDNKNGSTVVSTTKYVYDKLWRTTQVSNPFAPGDTPVYSTTTYDGLGRITRVTPPSAGYTQYDYLGNTVTITDPAGKKRKNYSDGLGRLVEVDEPGWGDAQKSTGTVTIAGFEQKICDAEIRGVCRHFIWDTGTVSIIVNGVTKSTNYNSASNAMNVASSLVTNINMDTSYPVTASANGAIITLTSAVPGANTNYTVSGSSSTTDPTDFGGPSFSVSVQTPTMSGGVDAVPVTAVTLARPIVTTYGYDLLDDLTSVSQDAMSSTGGVPNPGQPRTYAYDSLGRLTSVTAPESGAASIFYTDAGGAACATDPSLACRVQDARGVVKTLTYDGINRPTGYSFSDGTPSVAYAYDSGGAAAFALGRLTSTTENSNSEVYAYDNLGHITSVNHTIDGTHYITQFGYNLFGRLSTTTYPSGRVVTANYDAIGRTASIVSGSTTYLSGISYTPAGRPAGFTLGNNIQGAFIYNDHLQLQSLRYFKTGLTPDPLNLSYDYTSTAQPNNNGQIQAIHYFTQPSVEDQTKSETFTYDPWFRLSAAQTISVSSGIAGTWSLQWGYDRLGNRLSQTLVGGNISVNQPLFSVSTSTNRITNSGYQYDAAGNLTNDSVNAYAYDGAGRLKQFNATAAAYTFFGSQRIKKVVGATTTVYIYSGAQPIAEYTNGTLSAENIYFGSQLLTVVTPSATTYYHPDHLSTRAQTDATGTPVLSAGTLPFGDPWYATGSPYKWKFTSYEGDSESNLHYAQARFYYPTQGRFTAADPFGGSLENPQSLNRYAYVGSDPVNRTDPSGLLWGSSVLCLFDDKGNATTTCAKFVDDPELRSIACSGAGFSGYAGPKSFCEDSCPVWAMFTCGSSATVLLIYQNQHNQPSVYSLGVGLNACALVPDLAKDPNSICYKSDLDKELAAITGKEEVCNIVTLVEAKAGDHISTGPCKEHKAKTVQKGNTKYEIWVPDNPMGPSAIGLPPILPRGPFIPPPIPPVTVVPR